MTPAAFRAKLADLGLSQTDAAHILDLNPRTIRRYASGEQSISRVVELALEALAKRQRDLRDAVMVPEWNYIVRKHG